MKTAGSLLLVGLDPPYEVGLARAAADLGLMALPVSDLPGLPAGPEPSLCVTAAGGDGEAPQRAAELRKLLGGCPLVVLSCGLNADAVVRLVRLGVADVIEVPAPIEQVAARALAHRRPEIESAALSSIVGETPSLRELRQEVTTAAPLHTTVLLMGETGTGKGLLARAIHDLSTWRDGPWVHVDCAALSPTVIESELFGHERGAFTGANALRRGRFELAEGGTLFLDEVGDLEVGLQTKLLRVLEDRRYERVGGSETRRMTARVLAATSHDLLTAVQEGRFRPDLYFRLNVNPLRIPPLRDRLADVPLLVEAGLQRLSERLGVPMPSVSDEFYAHLESYDWPGNVRELMNVIERCLVQCRVERLEVDDLEGLLDDLPLGAELLEPCGPRRGPAPDPQTSGLARRRPHERARDREIIEAALRETGGNIARAARRLGVPRSTLRSKIKTLGLRHLIPTD